MKLLNHIPSWLKNKYLLAFSAFVAWMLFFDKNDVFIQRQRFRELKELQQSKKYYSAEILKEKSELEKLRYSPATLEKYAREKYLMHADNEDLFLVPEKPEN